MSIDFNLSKEIMEELTGSKYPTIFEFEREGQEKIKLVRYEDYLRLHSIIKEVREYIKENNFHCKNQVEQEQYDKELLEILDKENK